MMWVRRLRLHRPDPIHVGALTRPGRAFLTKALTLKSGADAYLFGYPRPGSMRPSAGSRTR